MMIMRIKSSLFISLCLILLTMSITAQDKQLSLHDLIPGGKTYSRFVPRDLKQLRWCGDEYLYVKGDSVLGAKPGKKEEVLFSLERLNGALMVANLQTVGSLPSFSVPYESGSVLAFTSKQHRIHYDYKKNKVVADYALKNNWANYDFCPATNNLAFTEGNNVHILSPDGRNTIVTRETQDGIVCGQAVHQREFGITKGMFWSPKGSALAFYRMDERMVTAYPLVNIDTRCATPVPHKYPMAGMKSHEVTVGVYQVATGQTVWLETGLPKEKYLTNIAWSPDEKSIYIAELNREQNEMHLVRYSALTGKKEADLFTETDRCYVEPQHPVLFLPNDPDKFIWQSEADGYNHLYLYDTTGKELRKLTGGEWVVTKVLGFSKDGNKVIFEGTAPHPVSPNMQGTGMQRYIWETDLRTGDIMNCLSWKVGVHRWLLSPSGEYAIDYVSSPSTPRDIDLVCIKDAKVISTLLSAPDPFKLYRMPRIKVGHILAADGKTRLNYRLTLPPDLDETKKYPTIVYVYGGPKVQLVTGDWQNGARGWDLYMAQRGYVMFTVDSRGSANRGHAFESVIHRNLGINEMADQVKGVEFLKSLPYVDADRIGVHGWSYGGFMTTNLMLTYPEIFKVGVAGGPVIDWSNYEIMYGERYMDRPQDNPEGYKNANLKLKAGNLKGHLLMIHGDIDPVVVWQHSLGFLKACVEADTYPDYFVYPRHEHNVTGKDRPHLHEKITRYFDDYLYPRHEHNVTGKDRPHLHEKITRYFDDYLGN
mgnify:CR=1 FL=1